MLILLCQSLQLGRCIVRKNLQPGRCIVRKNLQPGRCIVRKNLQPGRCIARKNLQLGCCIAGNAAHSGIFKKNWCPCLKLIYTRTSWHRMSQRWIKLVSAWRDIHVTEGPSSRRGTFILARDTSPWHGTFFSTRDLHPTEGHSSRQGTTQRWTSWQGTPVLCLGLLFLAWDILLDEGLSSQEGTFIMPRDMQPSDGRPGKGHPSFAWDTCP
ncbi:hypothetical protein C0J52_15836 [Blattella germanica]|nr:hypothetical protein C0J52_15836 [Blattella germanica]